MAKKKADTYESKAMTTKISATSRISLKKGDTFYTLEYSEERVIPDLPGVELEAERKLLWDVVNAEVDAQAAEVEELYKKEKLCKK